MSQTSRLTFASVRLLTSLIAFLALLSTANAQVTAVAQVSGTIKDPSGASIANAQVLMTEVNKQAVHSTTSDATGNYTLPNLPVGPYRLEVKAPGFKDYIRTGLELVVNNNIEANVVLQVGSATERIEVSATASMVETKENSVASLVDQQRINELPLNGRQATQLIISAGAAVYADSGDTGSKTFWNATRISVAGGQGNGTAYLLDGADNTDAMSNVNLPMPFMDALEEFSIETSAVSSQFGTHPGATVNAVTKSGSNSFHGDMFEYIRNGDLDARNFFSTTGADTLKRNTYGGTAGGRIIKDKLFFFGGFQGVENRQNPPQSTTNIPTAAMLSGNFSTIASTTCGKAVTLTDPLGGTFPANQIPLNRMDPVAVALTSKYLPTASTNQCGLVTFGIPQTGDEQQFVERTDWVLNSKHAIYGRYFYDNWTNPPVLVGQNLLTSTSPGNLERVQEITIGDSYTFSPTIVNTFHAGFNRRRDNRGPTDFPINWTDLGANMYSAVPNFLLISSMTGGFTTYCGTCAPGHFNLNDYQVADDLSWVKGKHQFGFGFNVIRVQNNTISGFDENGAPAWNGQFTGLGMADFLLGKMSDFQQTNSTPDDLRTWVMSYYAQDSIRMNNHLVLNFGLRWEPTFSDPDKYKRGDSFIESAFLAGQVSTLHPNAPPGLFFPGDPGIPAANWNGQKANFAPRVGLVWNPSGEGKDTLRVGAALLYDSTETWFNERETTNPPYGNDIDVGAAQLSNPWANYPGGNPFPQHGNLFFPTSGTYIDMPINPKSTYVINWNVTYQREVAKDWLASVSYLGNKTSHLWIALERDPDIYIPGNCSAGQYGLTAAGACSSTAAANYQARRLLTLQAPATGIYYASIDEMDDGAVARYQGLLLSVQHHFAHHYTFLANYTDSYCLSDYDFGAALAGSTNSQIFNRHADWGPCISDTRQNFNASMVATSSLKSDSKVITALLTNWELAPLFQARSGQPISVTTGTDNSRTDLGNDRPVQVLPDYRATSPTCSSSAICVQWINPTAFSPNPIGAYGNVGRNALRGPGYFGFDVGLSRYFQINERFKLQFRAEAFNILNHTNFVGAFAPSGQPAGASYGTVKTALNGSTFGQITGAYDPRILQFATKLFF
jgi:hypothetical protein